MSFFDDVEEQEGNKSLVEGEYTTVVHNATVDVMKGRATIEHVITEGAYAKFHIWCNYQLNGKGKYFLREDLKLFNINEDDIKSVEDLGSKFESLIGQTCTVKVKLTPKKDKPGEFWTNGYLQAVYLDGTAPPPGLEADDEFGF